MPSRSSVLSSASTTRIPTAAQDTAGAAAERHRRSAQAWSQGLVGGVVAAHAVHAAAGWRRRRAQEQARVRRAVRVHARPRAEQELQAAVGAAGDVAADDVLVVAPRTSCCRRRGGPARRRGSPGRSARSGPRWRRSCRAWSGPARGSRSRACAGRRAPGWGRTGSAGRPARTAGPGGGRRRRRPRPPAISRSVPPRCRDPARRASGFVHGHRLGQGVVDLEHAGAVAEPPQAALVPARERVAADAQQLPRGDVEEHGARLGDVGERAHRPAGLDRAAELGERAWPSRRRCACEPPRAAGQPATWPEARSIRPGAEVSGRDSGRNEWAARAGEEPARLVGGKARPATVAGGSAAQPEAGHASSGWRGHAQQRGEDRRRQHVPAAGRPADVPVPGRAVAPRPATVSSSDRCSTPARPSSSGWTSGDLGVHQLEAVALEVGRREERRDRRPAGGWPSRRRGGSPGSVSSAVRVPPPIVSAASSTSTERPASAHGDGGGQPVRSGSHDHDIGHAVSLGCS